MKALCQPPYRSSRCASETKAPTWQLVSGSTLHSLARRLFRSMHAASITLAGGQSSSSPSTVQEWGLPTYSLAHLSVPYGGQQSACIVLSCNIESSANAPAYE